MQHPGNVSGLTYSNLVRSGYLVVPGFSDGAGESTTLDLPTLRASCLACGQFAAHCTLLKTGKVFFGGGLFSFSALLLVRLDFWKMGWLRDAWGTLSERRRKTAQKASG